MHTESPICIKVITLHSSKRDAPPMLAVRCGSNGTVELTECFWWKRPSTGKPYPIERQQRFFSEEKLYWLMGCTGAFDENKFLAALDQRARENTDQLLLELLKHCDDYDMTEYYHDVDEAEWPNVEVIVIGQGASSEPLSGRALIQ